MKEKEDNEIKDNDKEKKQSGEVTRRDFLIGAGTVVVGGAIGAGVLSGCGGAATTQTVVSTVATTKTVTTTVGAGSTVTVTQGTGGTGTATVTVTQGTGGTGTITETKTTTVTGTGGTPPALEPETTKVIQINQNVIAFDVKNKRIIRGRRAHYPVSWSITARGNTFNAPAKSTPCAYYLAYRTRLTSPNRVVYPLKRVDWAPGGNPATMNTQNRGKSNYVRISWDEAAGLIASEMKRVADAYGPSALSCVYSGGHTEAHNVPCGHGIQESFMQWWAMAEYGKPITYTSGAATTSSGGQLGGRYVLGVDYEPIDNFKDVADNCELLLGWGADPESKAWFRGVGVLQGMLWKWFGDLGIHRVFIVPNLNLAASRYADKWIPPIPTTDAAMMLAIAYIWLQEGTYDQTYLNTHTVGFDLFKAYVMGDEDGIPKTVAWASPICGVTRWTIKALAREWASKATSIGYGRAGGGAVGRTVYGDNAQRIQLYLQAMQGLGGPGKHTIRYLQDVSRRATRFANVGGVDASGKMQVAMSDAKVVLPPAAQRPNFPREYFYDAIFNPPVNWYDTGAQFTRLTYPQEGASEVRLMWQTSSSYTASRQWGFGTETAMQSPKLECLISQMMWLEDGMVFSDIILPITCAPEIPDVATANDAYDVLLLNTDAVTPPTGEAKSDLEAVLQVAEKLGYYDRVTGGVSYPDLVQARIREGYDKSGIADLVSFENLRTNNFFVQNPDPKWYNVTTPTFSAFYNDPGKNPLRTPSGKLEFESTLLKQNFPDDNERAPVAHYVIGGPEAEGWTHNEYPHGARAQTYPIMMVSDTSTWKHHSMFSDVPWTREIEKVIGWDGYAYAPVWIHPEDAAPRGIVNGDIVRVFNERGGVLGGAVINERIRPRAIRFEKAGGGHSIIPGELQQGGNTNSICPRYPMSRTGYGLACIGYLVQIEKVTGEMMDEWRLNYPEAFKRNRESYDPARGPYFNGWVDADNRPAGGPFFEGDNR